MARQQCTAFIQAVTEQQCVISGKSHQKKMLVSVAHSDEVNGITVFYIGIQKK